MTGRTILGHMRQPMSDSNSGDFTTGLTRDGTTIRKVGGPMSIGTAGFATRLYRDERWMNTAMGSARVTNARLAATAIAITTGAECSVPTASLPEPRLAVRTTSQ